MAEENSKKYLSSEGLKYTLQQLKVKTDELYVSEQEIFKTVQSERTFSGSEIQGQYNLFEGALNLIPGQTYTLVCDGIEYSGTCSSNGTLKFQPDSKAWNITFWDKYGLEEYGPDDYDVIKTGDDTFVITNMAGKTEFTLKGGEVKVVDPDLLPDTVATKEYVDENTAQSDWFTSDETDSSYVKNRTHWKEIIKEILVDTETFDASFVPIIPTNGETVYVNLNGTQYECVASGDKDTMTVGDSSYTTVPFNFVFSRYGDQYIPYLYLADGYTVEVFEMSRDKEEYHKISENYLPERALLGIRGEGEDSVIFNYYNKEVDNNVADGYCSFAQGFYARATGSSSHAEGNCTLASGRSSHAEGYGTVASGTYSHAEGDGTVAASFRQHAEGRYNIKDTADKYAHIVGNGSQAKRSNAYTLDWSGNAWFAGNVSVDGTPTEDNDLVTKEYVDEKVVQSDWNETDSTAASYIQNRTHGESDDAWVVYAEGDFNNAQSVNEQGYDQGFLREEVNVSTLKNGEVVRVTFEGQSYECPVLKIDRMFYFGNGAAVNYVGQKNESLSNLVSNNEPFFCYLYPQGTSTSYSDLHIVFKTKPLCSRYYIKVERKGTGVIKLSEEYLPPLIGREGFNTNAETFNYEYNEARGKYSHAEGHNTYASGEASHAEGHGDSLPGENLKGIRSLSVEELINSNFRYSVAAGRASHTEGYFNMAIGDYSHAEGSSTIAMESSSHAEGSYTRALGGSSHAEGEYSVAIEGGSHAEGCGTAAYGYGSHTEGSGSMTTEDGYYAHAEGVKTIAASRAQHVQGRWNIEDTESKYAHIVGNGKEYDSTVGGELRSNAHTLDWDGNAWYAGDVYANNVPYCKEDVLLNAVYDDYKFVFRNQEPRNNTGHGPVLSPGTMGLIVGEEYIVEWNNERFLVTATQDSNTNPQLAFTMDFGENGKTEVKIIDMITLSKPNVRLSYEHLNQVGTITDNLIVKKESINYLDSKLLPDTVATKEYVDNNSITEEKLENAIDRAYTSVQGQFTTLDIGISTATNFLQTPIIEAFPEVVNNIDGALKRYNSSLTVTGVATSIAECYDIIFLTIYDANDKMIAQKYMKPSSLTSLIFAEDRSYTNGNKIFLKFDFDKEYNESGTLVDSVGKIAARLEIKSNQNNEEYINEIKDFKITVACRTTAFLPTDNDRIYTPTGDYNPATKKYVDEKSFKGDYSNIQILDGTENIILPWQIEPGIYRVQGSYKLSTLNDNVNTLYEEAIWVVVEDTSVAYLMKSIYDLSNKQVLEVSGFADIERDITVKHMVDKEYVDDAVATNTELDEDELNAMITEIFGPITYNIVYDNTISNYTTMSNTQTTVNIGESFVNHITTNGYGFNITVNMNGVDITDSVLSKTAYNDATINIPSVTGNIEIVILGVK